METVKAFRIPREYAIIVSDRSGMFECSFCFPNKLVRIGDFGNNSYGCLCGQAKPGTNSLVAEVVQVVLLEALRGPDLCASVVAARLFLGRK